ncbi:hypothetical protein HK096_011225 [Nowakowskiella sp. JEL0078]|nr:hypothetical protein HK096_011225 [Nowakowskiella sp. JEL0078]
MGNEQSTMDITEQTSHETRKVNPSLAGGQDKRKLANRKSAQPLSSPVYTKEGVKKKPRADTNAATEPKAKQKKKRLVDSGVVDESVEVKKPSKISSEKKSLLKHSTAETFDIVTDLGTVDPDVPSIKVSEKKSKKSKANIVEEVDFVDELVETSDNGLENSKEELKIMGKRSGKDYVVKESPILSNVIKSKSSNDVLNFIGKNFKQPKAESLDEDLLGDKAKKLKKSKSNKISERTKETVKSSKPRKSDSEMSIDDELIKKKKPPEDDLRKTKKLNKDTNTYPDVPDSKVSFKTVKSNSSNPRISIVDTPTVEKQVKKRRPRFTVPENEDSEDSSFRTPTKSIKSHKATPMPRKRLRSSSSEDSDALSSNNRSTENETPPNSTAPKPLYPPSKPTRHLLSLPPPLLIRKRTASSPPPHPFLKRLKPSLQRLRVRIIHDHDQTAPSIDVLVPVQSDQTIAQVSRMALSLAKMLGGDVDVDAVTQVSIEGFVVVDSLCVGDVVLADDVLIIQVGTAPDCALNSLDNVLHHSLGDVVPDSQGPVEETSWHSRRVSSREQSVSGGSAELSLVRSPVVVDDSEDDVVIVTSDDEDQDHNESQGDTGNGDESLNALSGYSANLVEIPKPTTWFSDGDDDEEEEAGIVEDSLPVINPLVRHGAMDASDNEDEVVTGLPYGFVFTGNHIRTPEVNNDKEHLIPQKNGFTVSKSNSVDSVDDDTDYEDPENMHLEPVNGSKISKLKSVSDDTDTDTNTDDDEHIVMKENFLAISILKPTTSGDDDSGEDDIDDDEPKTIEQNVSKESKPNVVVTIDEVTDEDKHQKQLNASAVLKSKPEITQPEMNTTSGLEISKLKPIESGDDSDDEVSDNDKNTNVPVISKPEHIVKLDIDGSNEDPVTSESNGDTVNVSKPAYLINSEKDQERNLNSQPNRIGLPISQQVNSNESIFSHQNSQPNSPPTEILTQIFSSLKEDDDTDEEAEDNIELAQKALDPTSTILVEHTPTQEILNPFSQVGPEVDMALETQLPELIEEPVLLSQNESMMPFSPSQELSQPMMLFPPTLDTMYDPSFSPQSPATPSQRSLRKVSFKPEFLPSKPPLPKLSLNIRSKAYPLLSELTNFASLHHHSEELFTKPRMRSGVAKRPSEPGLVGAVSTIKALESNKFTVASGIKMDQAQVVVDIEESEDDDGSSSSDDEEGSRRRRKASLEGLARDGLFLKIFFLLFSNMNFLILQGKEV